MNKILGIHIPPNGDRYELRDQGTYQAIVKTHDKGTPIAALVPYQGATIPLHVGKTNYIQKMWYDLQKRLK